MAGVTAMAAGGEQTQSAHACDVSLGARIKTLTQNLKLIPKLLEGLDTLALKKSH